MPTRAGSRSAVEVSAGAVGIEQGDAEVPLILFMALRLIQHTEPDANGTMTQVMGKF
ncbi:MULTISPECIES: hypothetical protein [Kosakonia]|uniref:hypothetical protein n=1 Tax=Kosakonia TaxID=1330547 RepID=UPI00135633C0|nr:MULTISPECIES: hypothetical protein [Kosakonia]MDN2484159.1 hypothetical protein [Kosakonia sacchari]NUL36066.1 hypothetical protein [Kosakonia sacchari]